MRRFIGLIPSMFFFALLAVLCAMPAFATEYTHGDPDYLFSNSYNASAGTDYGTYRTIDLGSEYDDTTNPTGKWQLLNDSANPDNYEIGYGGETYCVGKK